MEIGMFSRVGRFKQVFEKTSCKFRSKYILNPRGESLILNTPYLISWLSCFFVIKMCSIRANNSLERTKLSAKSSPATIFKMGLG